MVSPITKASNLAVPRHEYCKKTAKLRRQPVVVVGVNWLGFPSKLGQKSSKKSLPEQRFLHQGKS